MNPNDFLTGQRKIWELRNTLRPFIGTIDSYKEEWHGDADRVEYGQPFELELMKYETVQDVMAYKLVSK
jgi:hypothetical protein